MSDAGKRALVTGINGFTGRYVAAELSAAGYRVFGLGTASDSQPDCYQVDLMDASNLKKIVNQIQPNVVVHLAAIAYVGHGDADAFYNVNLLGTRNLLQALSECTSTIDSILLASSANVYGNSTTGQLPETTVANPANDYAVSKLAMEYMAKLWIDKLPIFITRPFNYTGVGQAENFLLPKIVKHFKEKAATIELGNIDVWRDFTDVRALSSAYVKLLEIKPHAEVINICSGRTYSLRKTIELCEKITGHHINVQVNPNFVRANEVKTLSGDTTKLKSFIPDWNVPPLEETLRWMLEN
ncbi:MULTISPECIES: GDP-mannose 4,6-dehydratase [Enterobacteriaceae]|uniref:GDP-mannose 4,6-dehydratase n=1 Tax=Enterobacteriaceae TaxID=543 RepID=UPI0015DD0BB6|nr:MULTISPECIES: GDP-mannose 4,6-dehydratase [unclassified Klebsiella]HAT3952068.1 NAD-dependent epimerase/dehydratase family protein [Kluyvera ascorbata]BBR59513.1 GDP-6-deoxy-D-lyxo-4-hexulose reductase [Klebsiella sp. WP4-W18-ESBL-05]BBS91151.1 GDP-6-deoxy-D-lyxo-4-hexulose reductase [Klebsiella sp. WP7-S18-CRE-02]BBS96174.1 GDP-6-deoxy-D-lyxo-4-hexulose reductase [Klebsiella sp. WP7-S18-CRE-03]BBT01204.1 GDP-6-deoxy-D-lyxo-4-hexulose reductase [Klebsiella sp. WP7-S18-ESBL-04]